MTVLAIIFASVLVFVAIGEVVERRRLRNLASRSCTGTDWRRTFPSATNDEIREFLQLVLDSFAISDRYLLRFDPDVRLMQLYNAVEPPVFRMGADAEELETLADTMRDHYSVDFVALWNQHMTLGEAFALTQET